MWDLWWTKRHYDRFKVFRSPTPSIPPIAPHSSSIIIRGWYNRPVVASVIVDYGPLNPPLPKEKDWRFLGQTLLHLRSEMDPDIELLCSFGIQDGGYCPQIQQSRKSSISEMQALKKL
jgi:hypothetical protein